MSIRKAGGDWAPLLLVNQPRSCRVCGKSLWRNVTFFRGGWSRCTVCEQFVHYSCLASGTFRFLKMRPRVCKACQAYRTEPQRVETGVTVKPVCKGIAELSCFSALEAFLKSLLA